MLYKKLNWGSVIGLIIGIVISYFNIGAGMLYGHFPLVSANWEGFVGCPKVDCTGSLCLGTCSLTWDPVYHPILQLVIVILGLIIGWSINFLLMKLFKKGPSVKKI